jgi:hypothetical protein
MCKINYCKYIYLDNPEYPICNSTINNKYYSMSCRYNKISGSFSQISWQNKSNRYNKAYRSVSRSSRFVEKLYCTDLDLIFNLKKSKLLLHKNRNILNNYDKLKPYTNHNYLCFWNKIEDFIKKIISIYDFVM